MLNSIISLTILTGAAESESVSFVDVVGDAGLVRIPAWTSASLGFKVCDTFGGTFAALRDEMGALVEITGIQTAAAGWYKLPAGLRGARYVKLWSETSGSDTNQAADRALVLTVKG
jgi:hypothetical protein